MKKANQQFESVPHGIWSLSRFNARRIIILPSSIIPIIVIGIIIVAKVDLSASISYILSPEVKFEVK